MIDRFTLDNRRPPESLDETVEMGYLGEVSLDPITRSRKPGLSRPNTSHCQISNPSSELYVSTAAPGCA